jgi:hypothetical protein
VVFLEGQGCTLDEAKVRAKRAALIASSSLPLCVRGYAISVLCTLHLSIPLGLW